MYCTEGPGRRLTISWMVVIAHSFPPSLPLSSQHDRGGSRDDARSRQLKERHKGSHGNHNRRYLADRKRNKGMGAPPRYWGRVQSYALVDHTRLECVVHKHSNITCLLHYELYTNWKLIIKWHSLMYSMQTWGPGFDSQWLLVFQALFLIYGLVSCPACVHLSVKAVWSQVSWAYFQEVIRTNEIVRSLIIT